MSLIELDEYLDLSDLESVNDEFIEVVDSLSEQWGIFYAASREVDDDGNYLKDNLEVRTLYLTKLVDGIDESWDKYFLLDNSDYWVDNTDVSDKFPRLKKMISKLPFKNTARIFLIFTKKGCEIANHRDHPYDEWRHEMIWIRFSDAKKFFVLENNQPIYIQGSSCWFDSKKIHGTETDGYGVSLRVDGEFTDEFRKKLFGENSKWKTIQEIDYDHKRLPWY
tara:strand:- start:76 stop:741 length:666 start_codon:yes stop_codon:yes gene_type:complete